MSVGGYSPTMLRWYFRTELFRLRERCGLSQFAAAQKVGRQRTYITHLELGRSLPSSDDLAKLLHAYGVADRIDGFRTLLQAAHEGKDWFSAFEGAAPKWFNLILAIEYSSTQIDAYSALTLPDLAQTPDYTEAVLRAQEPDLAEEDITWRIGLRQARQRTLDRPDPPIVTWVLEESLLHQRGAGLQVMSKQIRHLIALNERPNITVHIVPTSRGPHAGQNGSFVLLRIRDLPRALPDAPLVAYTDGEIEGRYYDERSERSEVKHYRGLFERLTSPTTALDAKDSARALRQHAESLRL